MAELLVHDFEVTAAADGCLRFPEALISALHLAEGDLFACERGPLSVRLDLYRDFLADNWKALAPAVRTAYLQGFLRRPLAALGSGGALVAPAEILQCRAGERFLFQMAPRGSSHVLYLYRLVKPSPFPDREP